MKNWQEIRQSESGGGKEAKTIENVMGDGIKRSGKRGRRMRENKSKSWRLLLGNIVRERWGEERKDEEQMTVAMANITRDDRGNKRRATYPPELPCMLIHMFTAWIQLCDFEMDLNLSSWRTSEFGVPRLSLNIICFYYKDHSVSVVYIQWL